MRLVLFRHGIAVSREDPDCPDDPDRPLTPKGERRVEAAARGIRVYGLCPDVILSSPYVRAVETARLAADILDVDAGATTYTPILAPGAPPGPVVKALRETEAETVLCAGHAPNLDRVVAEILGLPEPVTALRKAGAAYLEIGGEGPRLRWLMGPRALRRMGRSARREQATG